MLFSGQMQSFTPDLSFIWFSFHASFLRLLLLSHQLILLTRTFVVVCDKWKPCKGNVPERCVRDYCSGGHRRRSTFVHVKHLWPRRHTLRVATRLDMSLC